MLAPETEYGNEMLLGLSEEGIPPVSTLMIWLITKLIIICFIRVIHDKNDPVKEEKLLPLLPHEDVLFFLLCRWKRDQNILFL